MVSINNSINNTVGGSNSGVTNTLTVTNSSNTASSAANLAISVGGGTASDAQTTYTVTGVTNWSQGIDNSVTGDPYVLAASTALGTSNALSITTAGVANFPGSIYVGDASPTLPVDINVQRSSSGSNLEIEVRNTSDTASSQALLGLVVGGSNAGDPFVTYNIGATQSWTTGIDNSASDAFVISASNTLGTTNVISMAVAGGVSVVLGDFDVTRSSSGSTVTTTVSNTSNTASSNALQQVTVAGTSAGDAFTTYTVSGTTNWSQGIDNSASDAYVIAASTALGTTNVISASTAGEVIMPLQPTVIAYKSSDTSNATGDGTAVTIIADTEITDANADYNNSTGVYTASVTGTHYAVCSVTNSSVGVATSAILDLVTSNRTYRQIIGAYGVCAGGDTYTMNAYFTMDMDVGDTASWVQTISGTTKTVSVRGTASPHLTVVEFGLLN